MDIFGTEINILSAAASDKENTEPSQKMDLLGDEFGFLAPIQEEESEVEIGSLKRETSFNPDMKELDGLFSDIGELNVSGIGEDSSPKKAKDVKK
jgi:hypothetical protein